MASLPPLLTARSGRLKQARRLVRRRSRTTEGLFLAEGAKALAEALTVPGNVVEVYATPEAIEAHADLRVPDVPWHLCEPAAVASLAGAVTPQGLVAVCRSLDVPLEDVLAGDGDLVICADVRDPGNAGTVIRTADAAGASGVVLAGHSVDPYNDKTVRATVGSLWHLPIALVGDPVEAVRRVRASGRLVLAADGAGETDLFAADELLDRPHAWLLGNEAWGLPDDLVALADHRVAIPVRGRAESLNLAAAAAVCLYATARRR